MYMAFHKERVLLFVLLCAAGRASVVSEEEMCKMMEAQHMAADYSVLSSDAYTHQAEMLKQQTQVQHSTDQHLDEATEDTRALQALAPLDALIVLSDSMSFTRMSLDNHSFQSSTADLMCVLETLIFTLKKNPRRAEYGSGSSKDVYYVPRIG